MYVCVLERQVFRYQTDLTWPPWHTSLRAQGLEFKSCWTPYPIFPGHVGREDGTSKVHL